MKHAHVSDGPYRVPREKSRWRAIALAAAVHAGLFFFLWVGVRWQSTEPVAVEAEVWDMKTQVAAPPPPPPQEQPDPTPQPVQPAPPPPPAPAAAAEPEAPPVEAKPDIALERRKARQQAEKEQAAAELKRQQKLEQEQQEKAERLAHAKAEEKAQAKADAKAKALADAKAKALADAKAEKEQAELDKKLADKAAEKKLAADKADKAAKAKRELADAKAAEKLRDANVKRMQDMLGNGASNSTGTAAKSTGARADGGYIAAITAKIKSNIAYGGNDAGNPRAIYKIVQLPTGEIISVIKVKSSGIPGYDSAVENAIAKSSPLPKKKDGTVVREVEAIFDMKDQP